MEMTPISKTIMTVSMVSISTIQEMFSKNFLAAEILLPTFSEVLLGYRDNIVYTINLLIVWVT